jgi:tetratricopeptide (TPR) repeat protein
MKASKCDEGYQERKRAAAQSLVLACEELLRVEGPAALERGTRRSKAWWCKLRAAKGSVFPTWEELDRAILPLDLAEDRRAALKLRHRIAWQLLHDLEFFSEASHQTLPELPVDQFTATLQVARRARDAGDYANARACLRLLEGLLAAADTAGMSEERRRVLAECLCARSVCERHLGQVEAAREAASRALESCEQLPHPAGVAHACAELGRVAVAQAQWGEARAQLQRARLAYGHLGLRGDAVAVGGEAAAVLVRRGHAAAGEQELLRLLVEAHGQGVEYRYPLLLHLASLHLTRGDAETARKWLETADDLLEPIPGQGETPLPAALRAAAARLAAQLAQRERPSSRRQPLGTGSMNRGAGRVE